MLYYIYIYINGFTPFGKCIQVFCPTMYGWNLVQWWPKSQMLVLLALQFAWQGILFPIHPHPGLVHVFQCTDPIQPHGWIIHVTDIVFVTYFADHQSNVQIPCQGHVGNKWCSIWKFNLPINMPAMMPPYVDEVSTWDLNQHTLLVNLVLTSTVGLWLTCPKLCNKLKKMDKVKLSAYPST